MSDSSSTARRETRDRSDSPDKPVASLSLDLDDLWTYLRTHGDPGWRSLPSYLDVFVPRLLRYLADRNLKITVFVVGQDAALPSNREVLQALSAAGHEIGNHSFRHEPWLHLYTPEELNEELSRAEEAIEAATGVRPRAFRGPGYSLSRATLETLLHRGYEYDASTNPNFLGPLARAYYFRSANLDEGQKLRRSRLFGGFGDGFRPLRPYRWKVGEESLVEVPVTTMPFLKTPIHFSYLVYLDLYSPFLGATYFDSALRLSRWSGIGPSLLLHPLDFLGAGEVADLSFFPGMNRSTEWKLERFDRHLGSFLRSFTVLPLQEHIEHLAASGRLPERQPRIDG